MTDIGYMEAKECQPEFILDACGNLPYLPDCPQCGAVVLRTLSIPASVLSEIFGRKIEKNADLLACWHCKASIKLVYKGDLRDGITFLDFWPGLDGFPLWEGYPKYFEPYKVGFRKQTPVEREVLEEGVESHRDRNALAEAKGLDRHFPDRLVYQIGGAPNLHEIEEELACHKCGEQMYFLAMVPDHNGSSTGYFENDCVMMVYWYCPDCHVIHGTHQCD